MVQYQYRWIKHTDIDSSCQVEFVDSEYGIDDEGNEIATKWDILDTRTFNYSPGISQETMDSLMESELINYDN